jgi:hypothetical protein
VRALPVALGLSMVLLALFSALALSKTSSWTAAAVIAPLLALLFLGLLAFGVGRMSLQHIVDENQRDGDLLILSLARASKPGNIALCVVTGASFTCFLVLLAVKLDIRSNTVPWPVVMVPLWASFLGVCMGPCLVRYTRCGSRSCGLGQG